MKMSKFEKKLTPLTLLSTIVFIKKSLKFNENIERRYVKSETFVKMSKNSRKLTPLNLSSLTRFSRNRIYQKISEI